MSTTTTLDVNELSDKTINTINTMSTFTPPSEFKSEDANDMPSLPSPVKRARTQPSQPFGTPEARIEVIALEATIGAGKSTQWKNIRDTIGKEYRVIIVDEPVDEWTSPIDIDGTAHPSILEQMYTGKCSSIAFQLMALTQRYGRFIAAIENAREFLRLHPGLLRVIVVAERSAIGDMMFAKLNLKDAIEKYMYHNAITSVLESILAMKDVHFGCYYLRCDIGTIVDRITRRNRSAELDLVKGGKSNEYLTNLTNLHEYVLKEKRATEDFKEFEKLYNWIERMNSRFTMYDIDATQSVEDVTYQMLTHMSLV